MQNISLMELADEFGSDKGGVQFCAHGYARIYESLLSSARTQPFRLLEIGLVHARAAEGAPISRPPLFCPSLRMWTHFFPAAQVFGLDVIDFRELSEPRMTIVQGDQSNPNDLKRLIDLTGGSFDVIIDDGSHASHHQQIALGFLFMHLNPGGLYCIEDLHFQPHELELDGITKTRTFLRELRHGGSGARLAMEQGTLSCLLSEIGSIHFFDSQSPTWPLHQTEDALAVIRKKGVSPILGNSAWPDNRKYDDALTSYQEDDGGLATPPEFYTGSLFVQSQRIYSVGHINTPDPRAWGNSNHVTEAPTLGAVPPHPYALQAEIDFRLKGNALPYQKQGWDFPSKGGTWTLAPISKLLLRLENAPAIDESWTLEITAQGLVGPDHPLTYAEIFVNDHSLGEHSFGYERILRLAIPANCRLQPDGNMALDFRVRNAASPKSLGLSEDRRELGLLLVRLSIKPELP